MGKIFSKIIVTENENRPCIVEDRKAIFHKWNTFKNVIPASPMIGGAPGGQIEYTLGMVEFEDGTIAEVAPHKIRFTDNARWLDIDRCFVHLNNLIANAPEGLKDHYISLINEIKSEYQYQLEQEGAE